METLTQYLHRIGILEKEATPEELAQAKRQYRKLYLKNYQKQYRTKNYRKDIYFTPAEFKRLTVISKKYKMTIPQLCKKLTFCYLENTYLLPDPTQIQNLELQLRGLANNANQLTRYIHQQRYITKEDFEELTQKINTAEDKITRALRFPVTLEEYLKSHLKKHPEFITKLQEIIKNFLTQ